MSPTVRDRWLVALVVLALCVHAPALHWGFVADDHGLLLTLEQPIDHPTLRWWSLFDFGAAPAQGSEHAARSFLPWWTSPDWQVRFFRPLASLTHAFDEALFGRAALAHHATSFALYACLLLLVHALYRAAGLSRAIALCALAVFALEDGSVMPVGWIANRNTLIEAACAVAAVLVLLRGGDAPSNRRVALACGLALLACLAKESGVVTFAALALLLATRARAARAGAVRRRLARWSAAAFVAAPVYVALLLAAGYGTHSLFYVMPWSDPLEFARRALVMLVLGAQGALGPFSIDAPMMFEQMLVPSLVVALALGVPLLAAIFARERQLPHGMFFALWSLAALVPQAGTYPSDRLLFVPMIGLAPWIGAFASRAFERSSWKRRALPALVALSVLPVSALVTGQRAAWFTPRAAKLRGAIETAELPRDGTRADAIVLQAPSMLTMLAPDPVWIALTGVDRVRFHPLQAGPRALRIARVDERTLDVDSVDGPLLTTPLEQVFLSHDEPPPVGSVFHAHGMRVEIRAVEDGGVRAIRVELEEPLDHERWRFLTWRDGAFRTIAMPAIGHTLELARCEPLDPFLL